MRAKKQQIRFTGACTLVTVLTPTSSILPEIIIMLKIKFLVRFQQQKIHKNLWTVITTITAFNKVHDIIIFCQSFTLPKVNRVKLGCADVRRRGHSFSPWTGKSQRQLRRLADTEKLETNNAMEAHIYISIAKEDETYIYYKQNNAILIHSQTECNVFIHV